MRGSDPLRLTPAASSVTVRPMSLDARVPAPQRFQHALVALCADRSLQDVTVSDLCRASEVSRKTFYIYFDSVEAVALACFNEIFEPIAQSMTDDVFQGPREGQALDRWVGGIAARQERVTTLHDAFGSDVMRHAAMPLIRQSATRLLDIQGVPEGRERAYASAATAGIIVSVLDTWISRRFEDEPAHVATVITDLLGPGTELFFKRYRES